MDTSAFAEMDRRSILGRMIKLFPELESEMVTRSDDIEVRAQGRFTSARSYLDRQQQLKKLVNEDIPKNSKEIGVARSYGDLRENHEFKAAKEAQAILMRRRAELESMLTEVAPTDFVGFSAERAGMGTGVRLGYPDGTEETYFILGEWDRDEKLGIISSTTRMAQAVGGHERGERITAPSEKGEVSASIAEVFVLPEHILNWCRAPAVTEA